MGPPVVLRVAGCEPARPVERHAHATERGCLLLDVGVGPLGGRLAPPDRRVLGRQPERIPADRMQHVVPLHRPEPSDGIAAAERFRVAHVQVARGVGEHVERVEPRPGVVRVVRAHVQTFLGPGRLPSRLDLGRVVPHRSADGNERREPGRESGYGVGSRMSGGSGACVKSNSSSQIAELGQVLTDRRPAVLAIAGQPLTAQEPILDQLQVGVERERLVVDHASARERRHHERGDAQAVAVAIGERGLHVVVEAAPVVPGHEDGAAPPLGSRPSPRSPAASRRPCRSAGCLLRPGVR